VGGAHRPLTWSLLRGLHARARHDLDWLWSAGPVLLQALANRPLPAVKWKEGKPQTSIFLFISYIFI